MTRAKGVLLAFMTALYFCVIQEAGGTFFEIMNECLFTVWPATLGGGHQLERGQSWTIEVPANSTKGRIWGRTGCVFGGFCETGECGAVATCEVAQSVPATTFEYSINGRMERDYFGISLVGGFNLPMSIIPTDRQCQAIACSSDINSVCPEGLRKPNACMSACTIFNTSEYCCTGTSSDAGKCDSSNYSRFFKTQCPQARSYDFDNVTSNFTCHSGTDYKVVFCRTEAPRVTNSKKHKKRVVIGITIGGALIMALALMMGISLYWKKFRTKQHLNEDSLMNMVPNQTNSRAFTLQDITVATQKFSQKIGQGGFGSVFFGKLADGKDVAVKVLSSFSREGVHQFQNEVDLLSKIHHKNLVSLLGYCFESREVMLIYEYMREGCLKDHLYGRRAEFSHLNWKTRLKIALNSAQGLEYLHVGCTPKIIHRDVKTANILLDSNMNGKLADFGLSKMSVNGEASHVTTMVKGTIGYLDPDYFRTRMLTEKSDVYSFGVVLLEIICGRAPINASLSEEELNLVEWARPYVEMDQNPADIAVIIDKNLGGNYDLTSITEIAKLAFRCVDVTPSRPSVSEVVTQIKEAITHWNNARLPNSEGIVIEDGTLQVATVPSPLEFRPKEMEWADNSSNVPQTGR